MAHKAAIGRKASPEARAFATTLLSGVDLARPSSEVVQQVLTALNLLASTGWFSPSAGATGSIGRAACVEARDAAQQLVDVYGPAICSETGGYCVNPDDDPDDHVYLSADRAGWVLLTAMQRLADTGWLVDTEVKLERFMIREDYKSIRSKVKSTKAALEQLSDRYPRSMRDLERMVSTRRS